MTCLSFVRGHRRHLAHLALAALALITPGVRTYAQIRPEFRTAPRTLVTQKIDRTRMVQIVGALPPGLENLTDLGEVDPSLPIEHIQLMLQRPAERQAAFDAQVEALHRLGPSFHKWLSPETVGSEFGPSMEDIATVRSYLESEGFAVNFVGKSGMIVDFSGTAAQVEQSFHTRIHNVQISTGETRYSAVTEASVPEALVPSITGFVSLSTVTGIRRPPHGNKAGRGSGGTSPTGPRALDTITSDGPVHYNVGPQDFYTIYNENPLLNATNPINGAGQIVALVEVSDVNLSDLTDFRTTYGVTPVSPSFTTMHGYGSVKCTDPGIVSPGYGNSATTFEYYALVHAEWAGAAAPSATVLLMACSESGGAAEGSILGAEAIVDGNLAPILLDGFNYLETASYDTLFSNLWEQAASQGQTVVVPSTDGGADAKDEDVLTGGTHGINVGGTSATAWNVSVGGTDFQDEYNDDQGDAAFGVSAFWETTNGPGAGSAKSYVSETADNETCGGSLAIFDRLKSTNPNALCDTNQTYSNGYSLENGYAGGGGPSVFIPRPTWQTGTVSGLPSLSTQPNRLQPDISLFAGGYSYHFLDFNQADSPSDEQFGTGTDYSTAQMAGIFALIAQNTGERLGQPNYVLYAMAGKQFGVTTPTGACNGSGAIGVGVTTSLPASNCIFYDIETGNNAVDCAKGKPNCYVDNANSSFGILSTSTTSAAPAYSAGQGYDMATGIGSINIANLVNNWQNAMTGQLFTPSITVTSTPSPYVYGSTGTITFTVTVSGQGSFPTGQVTLTGLTAFGASNVTLALAPGSGCASGGVCVESASQTVTPAMLLQGGTVYSVTGTYSTTNENYTAASATEGFTVTPQVPTVTVSNASQPWKSASVNLSATVTWTGAGIAPTGAVTFQVGNGAVVTAACTGTASLTCTAAYNASTLPGGNYPITAGIAADANYATAAGTGTLTVTDTLAALTVTGIPSKSNAGTTYPFTVTAYGASGTVDVSFTGTINLMASNSATFTPASYTYTAADEGLHTFTVDFGAVGSLTVTATAGTGGIAGSETVTVQLDQIWTVTDTGIVGYYNEDGTLQGYYGATDSGTPAVYGGSAATGAASTWSVISAVNAVSYDNAYSSASYTGGGLAGPAAIAVDGAGMVWIANSGASWVSEFTASGMPVTGSLGYGDTYIAAGPTAIAIDSSGGVWVTSLSSNTVSHTIGAATPAMVPIAAAVANVTVGVAP